MSSDDVDLEQYKKKKLKYVDSSDVQAKEMTPCMSFVFVPYYCT